MSRVSTDLSFSEVDIKTFSEIPTGKRFVTFANRQAIVWTKLDNSIPEYIDDFTCPDTNASTLNKGFCACFGPNDQVLSCE